MFDTTDSRRGSLVFVLHLEDLASFHAWYRGGPKGPCGRSRNVSMNAVPLASSMANLSNLVSSNLSTAWTVQSFGSVARPKGIECGSFSHAFLRSSRKGRTRCVTSTDFCVVSVCVFIDFQLFDPSDSRLGSFVFVPFKNNLGILYITIPFPDSNQRSSAEFNAESNSVFFAKFLNDVIY